MQRVGKRLEREHARDVARSSRGSTGKNTFDTSATGVTRMARTGPALSALGMNRTTAMPSAVKHAVPSTSASTSPGSVSTGMSTP